MLQVIFLILALPADSKMRIYDLKGSTYKREVNRKKKNINLFKKVLKDTDFMKQEEYLHLNKIDMLKLDHLISSDVNFLYN